MQINSRPTQKAKPISVSHDKKVPISQKQRAQKQKQKLIYQANPIMEKEGKKNIYNNIKKEHTQKSTSQHQNSQLIGSDNRKEDARISSKTLQSEFDQVEDKLKNRDISQDELERIANEHFISKLIQTFYEHTTLRQQIARIILQIHSYFQIRKCLYAQVGRTGKYPPIGLSITPILLHSYHFVNQSAAVECIQDVTSQGKVDLIENMAKVNFLFKLDGLTQGNILFQNMEYLIKLWIENKESVFINRLIQVMLLAIKLAPSSETTRIESKKSKRSDKTQNKKSESNNIKLGKTFDTQNLTCMTSRQEIIKLLVIVFTDYSYFQPHLKIPTDSDDTCFNNLALSMLRLYIKMASVNVRIPLTDGNELLLNNNSQHMLFYKWAVLSLCDWLVVGSHQNTLVNKKNKHRNRNKTIFASILSEICMKIPLRKAQPEQKCSLMPDQIPNQSIIQMATFLFSILMPFHAGCSQPILSDQHRFLVVISYGDLILDIIANINVEDNVQSNSVGLVLQWMFALAEFCDQYKKRYKLEAMISKIQAAGIVEKNPIFQPCESMLYRVLIGIQKCLPKYSLKYYKKQYINKPGIFHLYFIDQILQVRQAHEVGHFLLELFERWVSVQMRDFNLLGYICKFMLKYLTANCSNFETKVKGIQALLIFFKQLTPSSIVHLNVLFYDSSFSDQACVEYTQQTVQPQKQQEGNNTNSFSLPLQSHLSKNQSLGPFNSNLNLSCILPPSTLSAYQQQSQIKSCGYSSIDRCVFINRNFLTGNQLCNWANILAQIFDDEFYYHCKYFYHLLSEAYLTKSDIGNPRDSLTNDDHHLNKKIDRIIEIWEQSITLNKVGLIQSIFQLFMCWTNPSGFLCNPNNPGLTLTQLKKILSLLLQHSDKMLALPYIYYQNWKEALKQMQANNQLFENFKKEQQKIRNKQLYLICSIVKFIQNLAPIIFLVIPKSLPLEFFVEVVKKYSSFCGGKTCWALLRAIGDRMSSNIFLEEAVVVLRHGDGPGKLLRRKLQLYRQLIFGHIEQNKPNHQEQNSRGEKQNSNMWGNSSKSRPRRLQNIIETQLKLRLSQIIQQCIEVLSSTFGTISKSSQTTVKANQVRNQKEELYNKMVAFEVVQEVFSSFLSCSKSAKIINFFVNQSSRDKGSIGAENRRMPSKRKQNQSVLQKLHVTIIKILFRDSSIVTKYERKLIMHFRILALSWVCNSKSIILTQYLCKKYNSQSQHFGLLNINQLILVLWHCAIDEQIQMRIQVLQILTNTAKSEEFSRVNQQLYYTCAILTLACSLQPKQKLKVYGEKIIQKLHDSILKANCGNNANCSGFYLGLALSLGYLIFNSKVSLPCLDIFDTFVNLWVRANKDVCYLLLSALDEIENQSYRFSYLKMGQNDKQVGNLGCDLKIFYMNIKNKRGWTNCQNKLEAKMSWLQNSESILKHLRCSIAEKIKHAKFLKSKKEVYFDIEQFLQAENMLIMQKVKDEGERIGGWQEDELVSIRNKNYSLPI